MSKKRISDAAGWVNPTALPKGPNGRALCRRCNTEVPKDRRSWCGDECVHEHKIESDPGYARVHVEIRDKGVCALCSLDCLRLGLALERATQTLEVHRLTKKRRLERFVARWYWVTGRPTTRKFATYRALWEMDHTTPVVEGGGSCGLDNLRTLCVWCHNRVTAELRKRLAWQRKRDNAAELGFHMPKEPPND